MDTQQWALVGINVVGGLLVLASYFRGLRSDPRAGDVLWGAVPARIRPVYAASMISAAAGYFAFTYYVLFVLTDEVEVFGSLNAYWLFHVLYALVLFPSALWLPLTLAMDRRPSRRLWVTIRVTLAVVGLASLCILASLLSLDLHDSAYVHWIAVVGAVFFCVQTAVLPSLTPLPFIIDIRLTRVYACGQT